MKNKTRLGWHWLRKSCKLGYRDGRLVTTGETLYVRGQPEICHRGLHASPTIPTSITYGPGPVLCRVIVGGVVSSGHRDKFVGSCRTVLKMRDVSHLIDRLVIGYIQGSKRIDSKIKQRVINYLNGTNPNGRSLRRKFSMCDPHNIRSFITKDKMRALSNVWYYDNKRVRPLKKKFIQECTDLLT